DIGVTGVQTCALPISNPALSATEVDVDRISGRSVDLVAAKDVRSLHELERVPDLEPEKVHVDAAHAFGVRGTFEVLVDPAVHVEAVLLEVGDLGARRHSTLEIDRQRAEVTKVFEVLFRAGLSRETQHPKQRHHARK